MIAQANLIKKKYDIPIIDLVWCINHANKNLFSLL